MEYNENHNVIESNKNLAARLAEVADNINKKKADELFDTIIQKIEKLLAEKANQGYYGICISNAQEKQVFEILNSSNCKGYLKNKVNEKLLEEGFKVEWTHGDSDVREMIEITFDGNSTLK